MKKLLIITVSLGISGLVLPLTAGAARADGPKARLFAKYDKNGNGVIDGEEKAALRKDFKAELKAEAKGAEGDVKRPEVSLKNYDKDKDGKLSDEEIAAIKPPAGKKKAEATSAGSATEKAGGKKKAAAVPNSEGTQPVAPEKKAESEKKADE